MYIKIINPSNNSNIAVTDSLLVNKQEVACIHYVHVHMYVCVYTHACTKYYTVLYVYHSLLITKTKPTSDLISVDTV